MARVAAERRRQRGRDGTIRAPSADLLASSQGAVRRMSTEVAVRSQDAKAAGPMAFFFDLPKQNGLDEVFPG